MPNAFDMPDAFEVLGRVCAVGTRLSAPLGRVCADGTRLLRWDAFDVRGSPRPGLSFRGTTVRDTRPRLAEPYVAGLDRDELAEYDDRGLPGDSIWDAGRGALAQLVERRLCKP